MVSETQDQVIGSKNYGMFSFKINEDFLAEYKTKNLSLVTKMPPETLLVK